MKYVIILLVFSNTLWSQSISAHKWQERVLIIRGNQANANLVEQQFKKFTKTQTELKDRKLVVYKCVGSICTINHWKQTPIKRKIKMDDTSFEIVLIGLDGGRKFQSRTIEEPEVIFNLIDKMPMRRHEVESNKNRK